MKNYLIPANTKKGILIMGIFRPFDLILFGSGVLVSFLIAIILPISSGGMAIIALAPALITGFLVVPVPNYHNMLIVITEIINFFSNQRNYKWKGWCVRIGFKNEKGK